MALGRNHETRPVDQTGSTEVGDEHRRPVTTTDTTRDGHVDADRDGVGHRDHAHEKFGGMNTGAGFFGWLVAVAMTILLTSIVGAIPTAVGDHEVTQSDARRQGAPSESSPRSCWSRCSRWPTTSAGTSPGGCRASTAPARARRLDDRPGRHDHRGPRGGLRPQYNVLGRVDLPRLPISADQAGLGGIIAVLVILVVTLVAAILGGKIGNHYHTRVDKAALREQGLTPPHTGSRHRDTTPPGGSDHPVGPSRRHVVGASLLGSPMSQVLSAVAWPYANGPRHIGHVAGFGVPSDVFSRYMRMAGHDVLMVSGTDEHGTPILIAADEAGVSPQELADQNHRLIAEDLVALGSPTTSTPARRRATTTAVVQELFTGVYENGYFVEQTTFGAISPSTGRTLPDRYIEGTCPICGYDGARGDQCDNCGNQLDPADLIEPALADQRRDAGVRRDPALLPRPAGAGRGAGGVARRARGDRHLAAERDPVQPEHPRGDPAAGDDPRHRLGHPGAAGRLARQPDQEALRVVRRRHRLPVGVASSGPVALATPTRWREWWNDPEARCRTTSWARTTSPSTARSGRPSCSPTPARATGAASRASTASSTCPPRSSSSEFLTMEGRKFSSSKRVVIYVRDLLSRYQPDAFRYFVAAAGPENQDSDFTWAEFVRRTNDELVAGWGNLVNRTATLIAKNFGEIPAAGALTADGRGAARPRRGGLRRGRRPDRPAPAEAAIGEAMRAVAEVNKYVSDTEPWKLKGDDQRERLGTILHVVAQCVADLNTILSPFLPFSANAVDRVLGGHGRGRSRCRASRRSRTSTAGRGYPIITGDYSGAPAWGAARSRSGTPVAKPTPVFTKLDPSVVDEELARPGCVSGIGIGRTG